MDFDVQRCTRHCAATGRPLAEGETFYSVLVPHGARVDRLDYAHDAWAGPPAKAIGWWKSRMPEREAKRVQLAPNDILLDYFLGLADQPDREDVRYVLALWLIRRRVLRLEDSQSDAAGREVQTLYCPRRELTCDVVVVTPPAARAAEIEAELGQLLYSEAK